MRSAACLTRVSFRWFGGDCSILLGAMLALKRRGRFGLLFIDGHADFYQPAANPNGEAASMDLAFATGYGPALLTDLEHRGPLVRPADTVAFGFRDADEQHQYGSQPLATDILALDLTTVRQMGVEAMQAALDRLTGRRWKASSSIWMPIASTTASCPPSITACRMVSAGATLPPS